jgi:Domain of unknown function (DUF4461)
LLHAQGVVSEARLSHFLPDAIELVRQGEAVRHGLPQQQLQALRSAFALSRSLNISFSGSASQAGPEWQAEMLEDLARAFDRAGGAAEAVHGCALVIGDVWGVDALGRAWLSHDAPPGGWARELVRLDMALARERSAHVRRTRELEASAAQAFGVCAVFASDRLSLSALYTDNLRDVQHNGHIAGEHPGVWRHMSVHFVDPAASAEAASLLPGAVLQARVDISLDALRAALADAAPAAVRHLRAVTEADAERKSLAQHVEKQLRLRTLLSDPALTHEQFKSGCYRLVRHRDWLAPYVESSTVRLSDRNEVVPGSHVMDIRWDFEV